MDTVESTQTRVYRASPDYELVLFDRLDATERTLLGELASDPTFYGVLRPVGRAGRSLRAVDRDTALLLLTLREPAPLPAYVHRMLGSDGGSAVTELVLDGVLEVWDGSSFVAGSRAAPSLLGPGHRRSTTGRVGALSDAALSYAAALGLEDRDLLASRLYGYNRIPISPAWARRLPDHHAVLHFLGGTRSGMRGPFVAGAPRERGGWIQWARKGGARLGDAHGRRPGHKLYVSPSPEALPDAFAVVVDVLSTLPVRQFKVGGDAAGVLRPDKLVAYFADPAVLAQAGQALAERLRGMPAQGVPFTAEIGEEGLLSWGIDPPENERPLSWLPIESWRFWVVRVLAAGISEASADGPDGGMRPTHFALERLRLLGVDVDRWVPSASLWRMAAS